MATSQTYVFERSRRGRTRTSRSTICCAKPLHYETIWWLESESNGLFLLFRQAHQPCMPSNRIYAQLIFTVVAKPNFQDGYFPTLSLLTMPDRWAFDHFRLHPRTHIFQGGTRSSTVAAVEWTPRLATDYRRAVLANLSQMVDWLLPRDLNPYEQINSLPCYRITSGKNFNFFLNLFYNYYIIIFRKSQAP